MNNILEVRNLGKNYATFSLKNVSFSVPTGYIMGFIGPNGAGKTTTIKSILNMIGYPSGEIKIFGIDNTNHAPPNKSEKNSAASKSGTIIRTADINDYIGIVMDAPFYVEDWTMKDVEMAVSPFYSQWNHTKYDELLSSFNIDKKKKIKELSRGMKVKLMLAIALSHDAKLLILDEPTSGLDPVARDEFCDLLSEFMTDEERSVLFSTHITSDLEKIADYITFILNGEIVFTGPKEELLEKYALIKGGLKDLAPEQKQFVIGLRTHETGFEGMIDVSDLSNLSRDITVEPITLEEIIIFMNKGGSVKEYKNR